MNHSQTIAEPVSRDSVNKESRRIREMFGRIAGRYDFLNRCLSFAMDSGWRRKAVTLSCAVPGDRILDVCCGTGDLALEFGKVLQGQGLVIATDFTIEMIEIAAQKAEGSMVAVGCADTLRLPFADASFDSCSVGWGIRNVENLQGGLREMMRVLKPGGRIVILESTKPKNWLVAKIFHLYFAFIMPLVGNFVSKSPDKAYSYLQASVYNFPNVDKLKTILEDVGYEKVNYTTLGFSAVAVHIGFKP